MQSVLSDAHYHSEEAAYAYVEARLWPHGPVCPHCGNADAARIGRLQGKTTRIGLYKCYACREPFNVKIGTVFEKSHVSMRVWLQAIYLMSASKKGISTRQLQRTLQCGLKTAWFLGHRIREMMSGSSGTGPLGSGGAIVEADETYITRSPKIRKPKDAPPRETRQVLSLAFRCRQSRRVTCRAWRPYPVAIP